MELGASGAADGARVAHLSGRIEEFVHFLKTRLGRSQRITAFYNSAAAVCEEIAALLIQELTNLFILYGLVRLIMFWFN